jgi:hypothetical protein
MAVSCGDARTDENAGDTRPKVGVLPGGVVIQCTVGAYPRATGRWKARVKQTGSSVGAPPGMVRRAYYLAGREAAAFDHIVREEYGARLGEVPKHHIVAALLRIAAAHRDELAAQLAVVPATVDPTVQEVPGRWTDS